MQDLGQPSSYLALAEGTPVFASDGAQIGAVAHVLAAEDEDIFEGIVIDRSVLPGGHRFADGAEVEEIYERGVVLKLDRAGAERLPEPPRLGPDLGQLLSGGQELTRAARQPEQRERQQRLQEEQR